MPISLKRVYEPAAPEDGLRILVERLWPRGLSKVDAKLDHWSRDLAPSPDLRKWFDHREDRWLQFQKRYHAELDARPEAVEELLAILRGAKRSTFVLASREEQMNNAVALRAYISKRL